MSESYRLNGIEYERRKGRWYERGIAVPRVIEQELDSRCPPEPIKKSTVHKKKTRARKSKKKTRTKKNKTRAQKNEPRTQQQGNFPEGQSSPYINHCWNCHSSIDSRSNERCQMCNMFKCNSCGKCLCGRSARQPPSTIEFEYSYDEEFFQDI